MEERKSRKLLKENVDQFVTVMCDVENKEKDRLKCINSDSTCRSKRTVTAVAGGVIKRARMETSTPITSRRSPNKLDLSSSPVKMQDLSFGLSDDGGSYTKPLGGTEEVVISKKVCKLNITPPKIESKRSA